MTDIPPKALPQSASLSELHLPYLFLPVMEAADRPGRQFDRKQYGPSRLGNFLLHRAALSLPDPAAHGFDRAMGDPGDLSIQGVFDEQEPLRWGPVRALMRVGPQNATVGVQYVSNGTKITEQIGYRAVYLDEGAKDEQESDKPKQLVWRPEHVAGRSSAAGPAEPVEEDVPGLYQLTDERWREEIVEDSPLLLRTASYLGYCAEVLAAAADEGDLVVHEVQVASAWHDGSISPVVPQAPVLR